MKARIKSGTPIWENLTNGEWYEITSMEDCFDENLGSSFEITDDKGLNCMCLENDCAWLGGGSWEILDED